MKRIYFYLVTLICIISYPVVAQQTLFATITYQDFYDKLAPYGTWINYPGYGEVWHPDVSADFRPYATNGYWTNTDHGLYWQSGYDWGWAPFHYGRWFYDDTYGWLWEPGNEWAPAWVTWGDVDDYYAWAPLAPEMIAGANTRPHNYYWNMVDRDNMYDRDLGRHFVDGNRLRSEASRITVRRSAPIIADQQNRNPNMQQSVPSHTIREVDNPVHIDHVTVRPADNHINVYRPAVEIIQPIYPTQSRRVDMESISPLREHNQWPENDFRTHQENIQRLPMYQPAMQ